MVYAAYRDEERHAERPAELDLGSKDSKQMFLSQISKNKLENKIKWRLICLS